MNGIVKTVFIKHQIIMMFVYKSSRNNARCLVALSLLCFLFGCILTQVSCTKKQPAGYQIIGDGLSLPDQTIFFVDAYSSNVLDSTAIKSGHFDFTIAKEKVHSRILSIRYFDPEREMSALLRFPFGNNRKSFHNWFFIEDAVTRLEEFTEVDEKGVNAGYFARVSQGGYENSLVRQYPSFSLSDSEVYHEKLADYLENIVEHSNSRFLIGCLFRKRSDFSTEDLKIMFDLFSKEARGSFYGRLLSSFFDSDQHPSSFALANAYVGLVQNVDRRTELNIFYFLGNGTPPYLQENVNLNRVAEMYSGDERVSFSHITMQKDMLDWKASLQYNRPAWPQFFVDKTHVDFLGFKYNFRGIPLIVFTDQYGRILLRIEGYHQISEADYIALIANI